MRDDLIAQVSGLLVGFTEQRDSSMRQAITSVRADITEGQQQMAFVADRASKAGRSAEERYSGVTASIGKKESESKVLKGRSVEVRHS